MGQRCAGSALKQAVVMLNGWKQALSEQNSPAASANISSFFFWHFKLPKGSFSLFKHITAHIGPNDFSCYSGHKLICASLMSMRSGYFFCAVLKHGCLPSPDPLMSPTHTSKPYGTQTRIPVRPTLTRRYTTCAQHKAIVKVVAYTLLQHIAHTFPSIFRRVRPHKRPDLLTALGSISWGSYVMTTF